MADSRKANAAPALTETVGPAPRQNAEGDSRGKLSSSGSSALQLDGLAELDAALFAVPTNVTPTLTSPPSSDDDASGAKHEPERPASHQAVTGSAACNDPLSVPVDIQNVPAQILPPEPSLDPALPTPTSLESDGSSPPVAARDVHSSSEEENHPQGRFPKTPLLEYRARHTERLPHTRSPSVPHSEDSCEAQSQSTELADHTDELEQGDDTAPQQESIACGHSRWGGRLIRRKAISISVLTALAGIGAVLLLLVLAPGMLSTAVVVNDPSTSDVSGSAAGNREPDEQWSAVEDRIELERQTRPVQEPITPRLVKTVRIYESLDQPDKAVSHSVLPLVGLDEMAPEQSEPAAMIGAASPRAMETQVRTEPSVARWSDSAASDASIAERLQVGQGEQDPVNDAVIETPGAAVADRRPDSISGHRGKNGDEFATGKSAELDHAAAGPVDLATSLGMQSEQPRSAPVTAHVNMRAKPALDADVITVVPVGDHVDVIGCATWCEVSFKGERGWIHKDFVAGTDS